MEGSNNSYKLITFSLLAMIFLALNLMFKTINTNKVHLNEELTYNMPRPKSYVSLFDLSARNIVRVFKNLFGSDENKNKVAQVHTAQNKLQKRVQDKLNAQSKVSNSTIGAAKPRGSKLDVSITDTSRHSTMSRSKETTSKPRYDFAPIPVDIAPGYVPEDPSRAKAEEKKKDMAEAVLFWTQLLLSQPTKLNVQKFLTAYREGVLDEDAYFEVASRMLEAKKSEVQVLGVFAISILPNPDARSFLALSKAYPNLQKEGQVAIDTYLSSYAQPKQLKYLVVPFQSRYPYIVLKAGEILEMALFSLKNNGSNDLRQPSEDKKGLALTSKDFTPFVAVLSLLEKSSHREVHDMAVRLLQEIRELIK